jgi:hypothetical protein
MENTTKSIEDILELSRVKSEKNIKKNEILKKIIESRKRIYEYRQEATNKNNVDERNEVDRNSWIKALKVEDLIDEEYYRRQYWWDFSDKNINVKDHYLKHGWKEGRNPNSWFDSKYYFKNHMNNNKKQDPLEHFLYEGLINSNECNDIEENIKKENTKSNALKILKNLHEENIDIIRRINYGELSEEIKKAIQIDPLIAHGLHSSRLFYRPQINNSEHRKASYEFEKYCDIIKKNIGAFIRWPLKKAFFFFFF